jgi:3-amino-4-hydroxybenzoic acid synthase
MMDSNLIHLPHDPIAMGKREKIKLQRAEGNRNRVEQSSELVIWFDTRETENPLDAIFSRCLTGSYTGIVLYPHNFEALYPALSDRLTRVIHLENFEEYETVKNAAYPDLVIASRQPEILDAATQAGFATCYRAHVTDGDTLHRAIALGIEYNFLMVSFQDPTNIPLELVIASLQATDTILIKEISQPTDVDDAVVTLGVMEVGADGVMFSPVSLEALDGFTQRLRQSESSGVAIEPGTVIQSTPVGMGYRSCIDLATLFSPTEGMLVGSTSQGGIFCCPEVFYLPYMELRPFRVNAGAIHSYVYNFGNRTDYMSELRAGSSVMIVDSQGTPRKAVVGRMKTEIRPLRLIEVEFSERRRVNILMQDDWHVRIFSDEAKPLNITELKPGHKVLGHVATPGRHVGIKVDEHILES